MSGSGRRDLSRRDTAVRELMDEPGADVDMLNRTYDQFRFINAIVAGWRGVYLRQLKPVLASGKAATLLDIGSGGGDVVRSLAGWAADDGFVLSITAIDPDERAHAFARSRSAPPNLTFRQAYSADLVKEGARFDVVTSNHLLHHLSAAELSAVLTDSEQLCRVRSVHSDIVRSRLAYTFFSAATRPFFHRSFIREDGLRSIRRSYRPQELADVVRPGWQVQFQRPYRNLLIYDQLAGDAGGAGGRDPANIRDPEGR